MPDPRITGDPTTTEWYVFIAANIICIVVGSVAGIRVLYPDRPAARQRRAAVYIALAIILVVGITPWVILGLMS